MADRVTCLLRSPHLSCKRNAEKLRVIINRRIARLDGLARLHVNRPLVNKPLSVVGISGETPKAEILSKNEQLAEKRRFEGKWEVLRTIFQPRALSSDIPVSRNGVHLFYNTLTHSNRSCIFYGFFRVSWYGIVNQLFNFSVTSICKMFFVLLP